MIAYSVKVFFVHDFLNNIWKSVEGDFVSYALIANILFSENIEDLFERHGAI